MVEALDRIEEVLSCSLESYVGATCTPLFSQAGCDLFGGVLENADAATGNSGGKSFPSGLARVGWSLG